MSLELIVSAALPDTSVQITSLTFSRDGAQLLVGTNRAVPANELLGMQWVTWGTSPPVVQALQLPQVGFKPDIDSGAVAFDVDDSNALVAAGTYSAYRADEEELWLVSKADERPPRLVARSRNASLPFSLTRDQAHAVVLRSEDGVTQLELIRLTSLDIEFRVPVPIESQSKRALDVAANNDRSQFAIAFDDRVVCTGRDGATTAAWPNTDRLRRLTFGNGDKTLFGVSRDQVVRFQFGQEPRVFSLPKTRSWAFSEEREVITFFDGDSFQELDLDTGARRTLGAMPHRFIAQGYDLARRRIGVIGYEEAVFQLRVFQY
ncbi:MAG: hypothetical protein JST54_01040 [Deltaproteobacteria bacterium]|nr:hypothetical protein [Deltaproteobacteria bacterium]